MKYSVWKKDYSESKIAEFETIGQAEQFAELLYKGNGKRYRVWILGVVKDFPAETEG